MHTRRPTLMDSCEPSHACWEFWKSSRYSSLPVPGGLLRGLGGEAGSDETFLLGH